MKKRENVRELDCSWSAPPANLNLSGDEIHVWRAHLDLLLSTSPWRASSIASPIQPKQISQMRLPCISSHEALKNLSVSERI
jgi:hypothetical protein